MSKSQSRTRTHARRVEPRGNMKVRIWNEGITLEELFLEGRPNTQVFDHLMKVARLKVISVFRMAVQIERVSEYADPDTVYTKAKSFDEWYDKRVSEHEKSERRPKFTENYILGVENDVNALVKYVQMRIKGIFRFVDVKDLPSEYQELVDEWRDVVRNRAGNQLVERAIKEMYAKDEIYFIDDCWQACQSLIDDGKRLARDLKGVHPKRRVKRDDRSFHGKESSHDTRKSPHHGSSIAPPRN